jgi:phage-related protein
LKSFFSLGFRLLVSQSLIRCHQSPLNDRLSSAKHQLPTVDLHCAIQRGEEPVDFKPMSTIGKGVQEIRIRTENAYRVFYVVRFSEAVYVLHTFQKKTQKTTKQDIEISQQRYQQMLEYRESQLPKENFNE